jgi:hypothetical protein
MTDIPPIQTTTLQEIFTQLDDVWCVLIDSFIEPDLNPMARRYFEMASHHVDMAKEFLKLAQLHNNGGKESHKWAEEE